MIDEKLGKGYAVGGSRLRPSQGISLNVFVLVRKTNVHGVMIYTHLKFC